jgi:hypothetical protein
MPRHKHADVIIAWANGEDVEYKAGKDWYNVINPVWDEEMEYRIKPKIVKREGWVNVYKNNRLLFIYESKKDADTAECAYRRIDCIHIKWKEA